MQQAKSLAREYLDKEVARSGGNVSSKDYDRALRKATASFERLERAAQLARKNAQSNR
jgi:hypothetical protein